MAQLVAEVTVSQIGYYSIVSREDGMVDLVSDYSDGQPQVGGAFKNGLEAARHLVAVLGCLEGDLQVTLITEELAGWKRSDLLFRLWYAEEVVRYQGWNDNMPTIGRVSLDGEISLDNLAPVVRWNGSIDSMGYQYAQAAADQCVAEGLASGYHQEGQSGHVSSNFVVLDGVAGKAVQAIKLSSYKPVMPSQIEFITVTIADGREEKVRVRAEEIRLDERKKEAMKEWKDIVEKMGAFDAVEVERFNYLLASDYEPPAGFAIAHKYTTGRGNDTVIVVKVGSTIRCASDKMVRVLIGKGGENIRNFAKEHYGGKHINVIS